MSIAFLAEPPPFTITPDGSIRIAGTRVTLDTVIAAYKEGATVEEIVQQYPVLELADIHLVIGYYLRRRDQVETYLQQQSVEADTIRREAERRSPPEGVRARLLARQQRKS